MSYTLPQAMIYQEVSQIPTAVVSNLNPYIYGANYSLRRYSEASEKALIGVGLYNPATGNGMSYPNKVSTSVVDIPYVKAYAEGAWLKYQAIPKSASNPVMLTSAGIRNKLRAAPRIVDGGSYNSAGTTSVVAKGCHTGTVALPEAYYLTYAEDFTLGSAAGSMNYLTTEGLTGTFDIPADATANGVKVQGPDGLVLNMTNGRAVKYPITAIRFESSAGSYFTVSFANLQAAFDNNLTSGSDKFVLTTNKNAELEVTYAAKLLTIKTGLTGAQATLAALRAAIVATDADAADFSVSAISGTSSEVVATVTDQLEADISAVTAQAMIPYVYKTLIYENSWVFKTANDVSRTGSLYKDVQVGDKIKWSVIPASTGIEVSGYSSVAGLEADYSRPTIGGLVSGDDNQIQVTGTDISSGLALITASEDNDNENVTVADTKVHSLSAVLDYPVLSMAANILSDTYTITITTGGVAGAAKAAVTNASGTYRRTNVPIEIAGSNQGRIYIGNNMYVDFKATDGFTAGNIYSVDAVASPFIPVTVAAVSGAYAGSTDTTYQIEVTRGGVFTPTAEVLAGITSSGTLVASISNWLGGDVDDEYILEVTTAGSSLSSTVFELKSQRGDNQTSVSLVDTGAGNAVTVGASGLSLYFSAATSFSVGQYFVIIVRAARPKVRITDSTGSDQETSTVVTADALISVGLNGVKLSFPTNRSTLGGFAADGGLVKGDVFTIAAQASAAGAIQTIVLSDDLPVDITAGLEASGDANYEPDLFAVDLMLVAASKAIPRQDRNPLVAAGGFNWTANPSTITLKAGIKLQDSNWVDSMGEMPYIELIHGNLYVEYRALLLDYSDAIYSVSDISQVVPKLGPAVEDNPLALAVYCNIENLRGTCYFSAVTSDNVQGDTGALAKAGLITYTYALSAAGVTDPARHSALEAHVNAMSTETKKRWRTGFVGRELPTVSTVYAAANNSLDRDWKATVTADSRTGLFTKVTLDQEGSALTALKVGDQIRLQFNTDAWGEVTYTADTVAEIESNTVFYLSYGVQAAIPVANKIEAYHPLDVQEQADMIKAISEGYANKRMYCVFPGHLGKYGTYVNAAYGAAAVAGVVGSVVPHQGLTNIELNGFNDVPLAYGTFDYDQLNSIASGGTLIIMQDTKAGSVYIRHQISTATKDGNLNTTELSMVKNLDSISFFFADLLKPFIGRYNVTPEMVSVMRTQVQDGLNYLGSLTSVGLLGPQIILSNGKTKIRTFEQHPTLKDRLLAIVDLELPAPLNVIEFHIVV